MVVFQIMYIIKLEPMLWWLLSQYHHRPKISPISADAMSAETWTKLRALDLCPFGGPSGTHALASFLHELLTLLVGSMIVWSKQMIAATQNTFWMGEVEKCFSGQAALAATSILFIQEVLQWCFLFDWRRPAELVALLLLLEGNPQWPKDGLVSAFFVRAPQKDSNI